MRHALEEYIREAERRAGHRHVHSPVPGTRELYELSGHWAHCSDGMFPPTDLGGEQVVLRPGLRPHHALIHRSRSRSYRERPLRLAELGGMYRSAPAGAGRADPDAGEVLRGAVDARHSPGSPSPSGLSARA
ncbi:hypothetical protein GCM10010363_72580 [Streptomyces omiyaensis]|nr:hypothetical protein GCM10010363_72580 [Streptomyces omiyaensis]